MNVFLEWIAIAFIAGAVVMAVLAGVFGACLAFGGPCSFDTDWREYLKAYALVSGMCAIITVGYPLFHRS